MLNSRLFHSKRILNQVVSSFVFEVQFSFVFHFSRVKYGLQDGMPWLIDLDYSLYIASCNDWEVKLCPTNPISQNSCVICVKIHISHLVISVKYGHQRRKTTALHMRKTLWVLETKEGDERTMMNRLGVSFRVHFTFGTTPSLAHISRTIPQGTLLA